LDSPSSNQRRALGALLGGTFGAAVGVGVGGIWDWIYLFDVPVHRGPGAFIGLGIGGLVGVAWGLLAAWPQRWWAGVLLSVSVAGILVSVPTLYDLIRYSGPLSDDFLVSFAMAPLAIFVLPDFLLAGLFRGLLGLIFRVRQRWERPRHWGVLLVVLLLVALGLGLTWPVDRLNESMEHRRADLWAVHRYAQDQGWQDCTLEWVAIDSDYATIRVRMPDGEEYTCETSPWSDSYVEYVDSYKEYVDSLDVTCWP